VTRTPFEEDLVGRLAELARYAPVAEEPVAGDRAVRSAVPPGASGPPVADLADRAARRDRHHRPDRRAWVTAAAVVAVALIGAAVAGMRAAPPPTPAAPVTVGPPSPSAAATTPDEPEPSVSAPAKRPKDPPPSPLTPSTTVAVPTGRACRSADLVAALDMAQGATGHMMVWIRVTNRSATRCVVTGHPDVVLLDAAGARIPFTVDRGTGWLAPADAPVRPVAVEPGGAAEVVVEKYRCDLVAGTEVRTIRLGAPGDQLSLTVDLPADGPFLAWCPEEEAGRRVDVSPFRLPPTDGPLTNP
jgi:hypothetical protein